VQHNNALAAGAGYSASGSFTPPRGLAAGGYHFIIATDRPVAPPGDNQGVNRVYEADETNNALAHTAATTVSAGPVPELIVSGVTAPATATSGGTIAVSWTVANGGADTAAVPITDSVYLSYDKIFDPTSDRYVGSVTYPGGLAAGGSYTQNAILPLRPGVAGTFYVFVLTNSDGRVPEQDTSNDSAHAARPVQVHLMPPADLVAGTVTIPPTAVAGENITISYQITNGGGNPANGSWYDALYLSPTSS
jgi:hypothetical protein